MKNLGKISTGDVLAGCSFLCLAFSSLHGAELGPVAIHGSISGTVAYSDKYNYHGDTADAVDFNHKEIILNGTHRFESGVKVAAQIYAYELAGYEDITLDFANIDYSFRQEIGVRVGRNKLASGLYNEVQDLDQVRTFASLPLNFYGRATRPFGASYDGVGLYGNVPAGKAGSFDHQIYAGVIQPLDEDMPFMRGLGASELDLGLIWGAAIIWNTPVEGLRLGYTYQTAPEIDVTIGVLTEVEYLAQVFSAEFITGDWIFAAEYKRAVNKSFVPAFGVSTESQEDHGYAQATYQVTPKLGVGVYYAYSDYSAQGVIKDAAVAASYALAPWWLVKAEVHAMDGVAGLNVAGDPNVYDGDRWTYIVLKTTLSF